MNFDQLQKAVDWSVQQLETPRKKRLEAIKQFVGLHYNDNGSERVVPTNFLELAVTIYVRMLAARSPRAMVKTGNRQLKPFAKNLEIVLNQVPDEIDLGGTIRSAVLEALFSVGVVKVGLSATGKRVMDSDYGEPYVDLVSIDDYFCDMSAKNAKAMQFQGNDYWLPLETVRAMVTDRSVSIEPDDHTTTGNDGGERAEGISVAPGADMYAEKVWCRDVWIAAENKLVTYGVTSKRLFNVIDWDGPIPGPYHVLGFSTVPGNLLPLPPIALWRDLHDLGNNIFRKLGRQAESKKTVAAFQGGNDDDVLALKAAGDGDGIRYHGQKPEEITVGGIDAPTLAFYIHVRDLFSYFSGNIDTLGGLSPATDTVGQDKLLNEAAGARLNDMTDSTVKFVRGIFKSLAWYEWTDPVRTRVVVKTVPGTSISIKRAWTPETRDGDFLDYNFDIDAFSMQDDSPTLRLQKIGAVLERYVFPGIPLLQQQGGYIDYEALMETVGRLSNIPELADIIKFQESDTVPQQVQGGSGTPSTMPANTTRTYERVNRPGASRQGKDNALAQVLMGGNPQAAEKAQIGRKVS